MQLRIRIRIREQLCILVAVTSLLALMVLSLSTVSAPRVDHERPWLTVSKTLTISASLKATQVSQILQLYKDLSLSIATRNAFQKALDEYTNGNSTGATQLQLELHDALAGGVDDNLLLQAAIYPPNGPASQNQSAIVMVTGEQTVQQIVLPYNSSNGSIVYLGDAVDGYPAQLYPNLTWTTGPDDTTTVLFNDTTLGNSSAILLGPLLLEENSSALMSMTIAVDNNTNRGEILGWLTVVLDASLFYDILANSTDLGSAGEVILLGPVTNNNLFARGVRPQVADGDEDVDVRFVFQPSIPGRHPHRIDDPSLPFNISAYPAVGDAYTESEAGAHLSSHNEEGQRISCGYAQVNSNIADWVVIFEASRSEVMAPINKLRNTILICIFSVFAAIIVICFPLAHYAVKPIRALKSATENSIMMYEAEVPDTSSTSMNDPESLKCPANGPILEKLRPSRKPKMQRRRQFQIPERVPDRRHLIHNELSDLTTTFNEMSDELKVQYARLEERVRQRTAELAKSRDLARAADESKTLFIANVSHELRTPLNGIIGMCSVAMQEDDISRVRQSLNIIYKSSDLLSRLLNDLLTFSRNSYGQQLSIEHSSFRLGDIGTQIVSIFEKQAREKDVNLRVVFQGVKGTDNPEVDESPEDVIVANPDVGRMLMRTDQKYLAQGPADTGPLRDMTLLGDKNRILQILMNLVSNSLKFTPEKGTVEVRIRCKGFMPEGFAPLGDMDSGTTIVDAAESSPNRAPPTLESGRSLNFDFEVEDTGPGVPEHLQQEIFKPFVQGDLALSRKHGGTGLGLAICIQLANLMGGRMHLKSTVDIGSTFTCNLPLHYSKEEVPSVAGSIAPRSSQPSISHSTLAGSAGLFSTRSARSLARTGVKTQTVRNSAFSGRAEPQTPVENPRVHTLSHSNLAEDNRPRSAAWSLKSRLSRQFSPGMSLEKAEPEKAEPVLSNVANPDSAREVIDIGVEKAQDETLPAASTPVESKAASPKSSPKPKTPDKAVSRSPDSHILVAEDNKVNQEVIMRMLKLEKFTNITLAEDGVEAVKRIRSNIDSPSERNISLIFMDIQMPNMDGCEATKQIRDMGFGAPIVALTAFDHQTNRDACKSVGMDDFIGKPVKRKALREILDKETTWGSIEKSYLPSVELESHTLILASTSRTTLKQTYVNTTGNSLQEALYTFPLYDGVSVVSFRCTIKDKVLTGVVKERQQARKDYNEAVEKGETAGLLEQLAEAADVFTTRIGNVPVNEKILVEIVYLGELKHDAETDGSRFTVPTRIAPRYGSLSHDSTNKLTTPSANDSGGIRISVDVALDSASVIQGLQSPSHPIAVAIGRTTKMPEDAFETNKASATLALQTTELDRDFILVVVSKSQGIPRALMETHPTISHQRAVMATLVPKFNLPSIIPEIVFVVDRSGSMSGKIQTLVAAMKVFLKSLPVNGVKFNVCSFGSTFSFLFEHSRTYDESSLEEALSHISSFGADLGGTEILPAIEAVCNMRSHHMSLEVMILTDGQIWNQNRLFEFIGKQKNTRCFSLGIGAGASSSLVEGIARAGNGFSQFVGDNEKMDKRIVRMLKGALTPHIHDYTLTLKYSDTDDDDDFEMVEVSSVTTLVHDTPTEPTNPTGDKSEKIISLYDENVKEEPIKSVDKHDSLPNITAPAVLQAPDQISQLYPFQRTTVYLLLGPDSPQKRPKSVLLSATSEHGRLELEIAIEDIGHGLSIHQLAAKKAVQELEQGRGWLAQAKSDSDQLLEDKYATIWDGIVERECVRLGTMFQVAGKYSSFVAVEKRNKQADTGGKEGATADIIYESTGLGLFGNNQGNLPLSASTLSRGIRPAPPVVAGRGLWIRQLLERQHIQELSSGTDPVSLWYTG
ncbi:hypothetical protein DV738_g4613, partial [Chaetothyriales sp. CBS 135597]